MPYTADDILRIAQTGSAKDYSKPYTAEDIERIAATPATKKPNRTTQTSSSAQRAADTQSSSASSSKAGSTGTSIFAYPVTALKEQNAAAGYGTYADRQNAGTGTGASSYTGSVAAYGNGTTKQAVEDKLAAAEEENAAAKKAKKEKEAAEWVEKYSSLYKTALTDADRNAIAASATEDLNDTTTTATGKSPVINQAKYNELADAVNAAAQAWDAYKGSEDDKEYQRLGEAYQAALKARDDYAASGENPEMSFENTTEDHSDTDLDSQQIAAANQRQQAMDAVKKKLKASGYSDSEIKEIIRYGTMNAHEEQAEEDAAAQAEAVTEGPLGGALGSAVSVVTSPVGTVVGTVDLAAQAVERAVTGSKAPIDTYTKGQALSNLTDNIRSSVSEDLKEWADQTNISVGGVTAGDVVSFTYQTAMSGFDSALAAVTPGGALLLGTNAGLSATKDALREGADAESAIKAGIANAIFESLFEEVSLSQLRAFQPGSVTGWGTFFKNLGKEMFTNASEEAFTQMADDLANYYFIADKSDLQKQYDKAYQDAIKQGMDAESANYYARKQQLLWYLKDAVVAGAGGALMGGFFSAAQGGQAMVHNRETSKLADKIKAGQTLTEEEKRRFTDQSDAYSEEGAAFDREYLAKQLGIDAEALGEGGADTGRILDLYSSQYATKGGTETGTIEGAYPKAASTAAEVKTGSLAQRAASGESLSSKEVAQFVGNSAEAVQNRQELADELGIPVAQLGTTNSQQRKAVKALAAEQGEQANIYTNPLETLQQQNSTQDAVQNDIAAAGNVAGDVSEEAQVQSAAQTQQETASEREKEAQNITQPTEEDGGYRTLTAADEAEYMRTGTRQAVRDEKARMAAGGNSPVLRSAKEIASYIRNAVTGKGTGIKTYGKVGNRLANAIAKASGGTIDISNSFMELEQQHLRHSYDGHLSAKNNGDIDLSIYDYENITAYIDSADDIVSIKKSKDGKVTFQLGKRIDGYSIITELVSKGRGSVSFVNMWGVSTEKYNAKYAPNAIKIEADSSSVDERGRTTTFHPDKSASAENIAETSENSNTETEETFIPKETHAASTEEQHLIARVAKAVGIEVVYSDGMEYGRNAMWDGRRVIISSNLTTSQAVYQIFLHELTHSSETASLYKALAKYARNSGAMQTWLKEGAGLDGMSFDSVQEYLDYVKERYFEAKIYDVNPEHELIAEFCAQNLFHSEEAVEALVNDNRSLAQKLHDNIADFIARVTGIGNGTEADELKRLERMLARALKQNQRTAETEQRTGAQQGNAGSEQYSIDTMLESIGLEYEKAEDGSTIFRDSNGKQITYVTKDHIQNSVLGAIIDASAKVGNISEENAAQQKESFQKLFNLMLKTNDIDLVWAVSSSIGFNPVQAGTRDRTRMDNKDGKNRFASLTGNADPQYSTTVDFTTICLKTKAVIDAMSSTMMKLKHGLTEKEVVDIVFKNVYEAGEPVPCPVCYVFSRWVGLGGLFDNMYRLQQQYADADAATIKKDIARLEKEISSIMAERGLKKGKAQSTLYKEMVARQAELQQKDFLARNNNGEKLTSEEKAELKKLTADIQTLDNWAWLTKVRTKSTYKPVPAEILFDINAGKEFAENYPDSWTYRTTRGPAMGKAASPYSAAHLGQVIRGTAGKSSLKNLGDMSKNAVLHQNEILNLKAKKQAREQLRKARQNAKVQNLLNGQRYQSTSDWRFEYGLDYLLTFIEEQAIGSKVQLYTKVPEAVAMFASVNAEVNCSLMPLGIGYVKNADGSFTLTFSDVTGMNAEDAFNLSAKYDNVQCIMVGTSDQHIRLCMADDRINFIIPYHASGSSEARYRSMMDTVGETVEDRDDYSNYQTDHEVAERTPEQQAAWDLRMKILTGKAGNLTAAEKVVLKGNSILNELYKRFYGKNADGKPEAIDERYLSPEERGKGATQSSECYGVKLGSAQAAMVMPYEYWDRTSTYATADEQGKAFVAYCESLGLHPRFSGWDSKGKYHAEKDFSNEHGYWKTLIDRSMYNNDGSYHEQRAIDVTNFNMGNLFRENAEKGIIKPSRVNDTSKTQAIAEKSAREITESRRAAANDAAGRTAEAIKAKKNAAADAVAERTGKTVNGVENTPEAAELGDTQQSAQYSIRLEPPPKKTGTAYKVFLLKDGKLYPPMVANPGGAGTDVGVWLNADAAPRAADSKTGRMQVQAGGKGTNVGKATLSYRPGWHLGDVPRANQFMKVDQTNKVQAIDPKTGQPKVDKNGKPVYEKTVFPSNFVWAECEYAMDNDYQEEAMSYGYNPSGKFQHSLAGLPKIPKDGYYRYRTNPNPDTVPWVITGAMKVTRILTDAETDEICRNAGVEPQRREGGYVLTEEELTKKGFAKRDYTDAGSSSGQYSLNLNLQKDGSFVQNESGQELTEWSVQNALYDALDHADAGDDNAIMMGAIPSNISEMSGVSGDFYAQRNHLYENVVDESTAKEDDRYTNKNAGHYHGIGINTMTDAILSIQDPVAAISTKTSDGNPAIIIYTGVTGPQGNPLYAVLSLYSNKAVNGDVSKKPHFMLTIAERPVVQNERNGASALDVVASAGREGRLLSFDRERFLNSISKKERAEASVTAQTTSLGSVTESTLKENITEFKKAVNAFKAKNKIDYSLDLQEVGRLARARQNNNAQAAEMLEQIGRAAKQTQKQRQNAMVNRAYGMGYAEGTTNATAKAEAKASKAAAKAAAHEANALAHAEQVGRNALARKEASMQREIDKQKRLKDNANARTDKARDQRDAAVKRGQERARKIYDTKARQELRGKIETQAKWFQQRAANPTDAKHVTWDMRGICADTAEILTLMTASDNKLNAAMQTGTENQTKAGAKLDALLRKINKAQQADDTDYAGKAQFADIADQVQRLRDFLDPDGNGDFEYTKDMDRQALTAVHNIAAAIQHALQEGNKVEINGKAVATSQASAAAAQEIRGSKGVGTGKAAMAKDAFFDTDMLTPKTFFNKVSGWSNGVVNSLREALTEGQRRVYQIQMDGENWFKDVTGASNKKNMRDFAGRSAKMVDIGMVDENGNAVPITHAELCSLWMHLQNSQNESHILNGGLVIPERSLYKRGQIEDAFDAGTRVRLDEAALFNLKGRISQEMDAYDDRWCSLADGFFNDFTKGLVNETSRKLNGYEKAGVENYFPIYSDKGFTQQSFEQISQNGSLASPGFTKARVEGAGNPIRLVDINRVAQIQLDGVSKYAGMAVPVSNFQSVWNWHSAGYGDSMQAAMGSKWKEAGLRYVTKLMQDIAGNGMDGANIGKTVSMLAGNYAGSVLTMNPVSALSQVSLSQAAAVLGHKAIAKAYGDLINFSTPGGRSRALDNIRAEMAEHTAMGWVRTKGGDDGFYGGFKYGGNLLNRAYESGVGQKLTTWIARMDTNTVAAVWQAAKYAAADKGLTAGSQEYWTEVTKTFCEAVEETQPNYTTMQQTQLQRDKDKRVFTMFKAPFIASANSWANAYGNYKSNKTHASWMQAAGTANAIIMGALISALLRKLLGNGLVYHKWDRDDTGEVTLASVAEGIAWQTAGNIVSSIYPVLGSEMFSAIQAGAQKGYYSGMSGDSALEQISSAMKAINSLTTGVVDKDPDAILDATWDAAQTALTAYGVPVNAIKNWKKSFSAYAAGGAAAYETLQNGGTAGEAATDIMNGGYSTTTANAKAATDKALNSKSYSVEKAQSVIDKWYDSWVAKNGTGDNAADTKKAESSLQSSLTSKYKATYVAADKDERKRMAVVLTAIKVNGKQIYSQDDLDKWAA